MHNQYIKVFYSLFSEYEGQGFMGNKEIMRYRLQSSLNRHIPLKYIDFTLKTFRDADLIKRNVTNCKDGRNNPIVIDDIVFGGGKYIWTKVHLDEKVTNDKLEKLSIMFENFKDEITELVTNDELEFYRNIFKVKLVIFKKVFKADYIKYYRRYFNNELYKTSKLNIYNLNKNEFLYYLDKIKKYNESYFISEKQYIDKSNSTFNLFDKEENLLLKELSDLTKDIPTAIVKVIKELISINDSITVVIGNNNHSIVFGEISINYVDMKIIDGDFWIVLRNDNCNIELYPLNININKGAICFLDGAGDEALSILLNNNSTDLERLKLLVEKYKILRYKIYSY